MSIYHMSMSNVSRAHGSSSCATLSYLSGQAVREDRTGQTYQYGRAERVVCTGTMIPDFAPAAFSDPAQLFNSIESFEQAENARTAKKICVALPREFDLAPSRSVIEDYIKRNFVDKGYCATYAIHYDKDGTNPHCHILIPNRQIAKDGTWNSKRKMTYQLDNRGNRIPLIDPATGEQKVDARGRKAWKRINAVANPLDDKSTLMKLRASWAEVCNQHLQPEQHIDARSYAEQGIEKIPTVHEGYAARALVAAGGISERVELNEQIKAVNAELMRIAAERQTVYANLIVLQREQKKEEEKKAAAVLAKIGQQEQRRQAARERDNAETERTYEKYWSGRLKDLDWRQLEEFCKGEYQQRRRAANNEAWQMYVRQNIGQITDYFTQQRDQVRADIADWKRKNPAPPQPEPRAPLYKRFFYTYQNSEGTTYKDKDYHIYKSAQEAIRSRWDCDFEKVQKPITRAEQELQYCKERNITKIIETLEDDYRDGHMYYNSKPRHGKLYDMIAAGAQKLIDTLKDFAPVREMIKVVNALAHDKAEDRRRDLAAEREQQQRQHTRQQGRGGYYR